jgi:hypothetical protein
MQEQALRDLVQTMDTMSELEKTVGEFYRECAGFFRFDAAFWMRLAEEEALHAEVLVKLCQMMKRKPHEYMPGKQSPTAALRTFISRIQSDRQRLKDGTLTMHDALLAAYHIETTIIECNYTEVVETSNSKCMEALKNLSDASVLHKGRIQTQMEKYRKGAKMTRAT